MFERFSSGYYVGQLYVEPSEDGTAAMSRDQHERVNEQLYATGEGVERLDYPLVMKLGTSHFAVRGDESVPEDTLTVPDELLEGARVRNPPTLREVLLVEADRARQLLEWTGIDAGTEGEDGPGPDPGPGGPAF